METIEYRTIDKSTWGAGPWQTEPDKVQFPDPETGMPCLIRRTIHGHLCGYVGVSADHPLFGADPSRSGLNAHGGINFGAPCNDDSREQTGICHIPSDGESPTVWWFGFDCGHSGDRSPGQIATLRACGVDMDLIESFETYCDIDYVKSEIASLAKQLKEIGNV